MRSFIVAAFAVLAFAGAAHADAHRHCHDARGKLIPCRVHGLAPHCHKHWRGVGCR
jgi:hypothetical protein